MTRRQFNGAAAAALGWLAMSALRQAHALSAGDISNADATQALKTALDKGASAAIGLLGQTDGFLGNPKVRIPLPSYLDTAAKFLGAMGRSKQVEELEVAMNRAAESAVPMGRDLLANAVKSMTVTDARAILTGGDTSVTRFFADKTRVPLGEKFLPLVTQATAQVGLADKYNKVLGKAAGLSLVKPQDPSIQHYVTRKSLDGLYLTIGEEEKKIRRDPMGSGSALLGKVFGAIR